MEKISVEDVETSDEDKELEISLEEEAFQNKHTRNVAVNLVFAFNKEERNELYDLRKKMMDHRRVLEKKGFSMTSLEEKALADEKRFNSGNSYARFVSGRDEFGLPIFSNGEVSGMKDVQGRQNQDIARGRPQVLKLVRKMMLLKRINQI